MKTLRLTVLASVVAVLTGCPGDKCKDVMCTSGQSCDPSTGMCVTGGVGGGGGNTGGGTGGNGGSAGGMIDAGPPVPLNMVCDRIAEVQCDKAIRCQQIDAVDRNICLALTRDNCPVVRDVNGMVAQYDGVAAAQCIGRLALTDCNDDTAPPQCNTAFVGGRGQPGTPCTLNSNCQADAGLYCRSVFNCGTCTAFAGPGEACNSASTGRPPTTCRPGLSCSNSTDAGTCVTAQPPGQPCTTNFGPTTNGIPCQSDAGFCPPALADGGARLCQSYGAAGAPCTLSSNCQAALFCNAMSQCEARRPADMPCTAVIPCAAGLFCPPATVMPRTCRALLADGQPCVLATQCAASYCNRDPDYYFQFTVPDAGPQTCGYLTTLDNCFNDEDCGTGRHCRDWHFPRPDAGYVFGTCANLDPDGGTCTNSETQVSDSCANAAATCLDARCVETPPFSRIAGQTCDQPTQCKWPAFCTLADPFTFEGVCSSTYVDAGAPCNFQNPAECGPAVECFFDGTNDFCVPFAHGAMLCDFDVGPSCTQYNDCVVTDGGAGGVCVPWSGPGGMCSTGLDGTSCYSSFCRGTGADGGACQPRGMVAATCTSPAQCVSNRCLNPDGGTSDRTCVMACY